MSKDSPLRGLAFTFSTSPARVNKLLYKRSEGEPITAYEFYSTPADAISIMLGEIMKNNPPDLVVCGISNGTNLGPDVYSASNIGMAMEATFFGVPAIALATDYKNGGLGVADLEPFARFIENNIEKLADVELPPRTFLSINAPLVPHYTNFAGVKFARMGRQTSRLEYVGGTDPLGKTYYWSKIDHDRESTTEELCDKEWFDRGFITITPINYDATDFETIESAGGAF